MNKNKKGKKNLKKIITLSALISLLSLIGITGTTTYAKYISNKTIPSQTATVAKWGYKLTVDSTKLFGSKHGAESLATTVSDSGTLVVASNADSNVVAPGTAGYLTMALDGSSEVLAGLTFSDLTIPGDESSSFEAKEISLSDGVNTYYPMSWSLQYRNSIGGAWEYVKNSFDGDLKDTRLQSVIDVLVGCSHEMPAGTEEVHYEYRISYSWPFEGKDIDTGLVDDNGVHLNGNEADTLLGAFAVNPAYDTNTTTVYTPSLSTQFQLSMSVTQLQDHLA